MRTNRLEMWLPKLILGLALYVLATATSFAQVVNCPGDLIQAAINAAPPGPVSITINGVCTENIVIGRDNVQLFGGTGGGVTGASTFNAITVLGASGVRIQDLSVSNGGGAGIVLLENAGATINNVTIADNAGTGLFVRQGSFARVENNTHISGSGFCEVQISEAGNVWMQDTTIVSNQPDVNVCVGLGIYRDASVRLLGTNSITNTTMTGFAIDVFHGSTLRQSNGHTTVSGNVEVGTESNMDFRDADITGNANVLFNSVLRFRDQGTVPSNVTVTGDIFVNETNVLQFSSLGPTTINGTIHCNGGTLFGKDNVTGATLDCPAPLHVLRADGSAKILVEELNAAAAPRNMFELRNNGPIGFNMLNTDSNVRWRFAAQVDGFRINVADAGDLGPEMTVFEDGSLQVGKNNTQQLFLDTGGNLTLQGTLTELSDVNAKTDFQAVAGQDILTQLAALPISKWRYKHDSAENLHLGPTAQAFHAAFGLGADERHLAPKDIASVALVGVKELHKMIEVRDAEIAKRDARVAALEGRVMKLEAALARVLAAQASPRLAAVQQDQLH
jgi:hypothetical protein